jgi:hypothetical protein
MTRVLEDNYPPVTAGVAVGFKGLKFGIKFISNSGSNLDSNPQSLLDFPQKK